MNPAASGHWVVGAVAAVAGIGGGWLAFGGDKGGSTVWPGTNTEYSYTDYTYTSESAPVDTTGVIVDPTVPATEAPMFTLAPPPPTQPPVTWSATGGAGQLSGIWRGAAQDIQGNPATVETVLQSGGAFSQIFYSGADPIYIAGTWVVLEPGVMRFNITDHTDQWCGPLGCTVIQMQSGETVYYEFRDGNTLVTWGYQNTSRVTHTRIG